MTERRVSLLEDHAPPDRTSAPRAVHRGRPVDGKRPRDQAANLVRANHTESLLLLGEPATLEPGETSVPIVGEPPGDLVVAEPPIDRTVSGQELGLGPTTSNLLVTERAPDEVPAVHLQRRTELARYKRRLPVVSLSQIGIRVSVVIPARNEAENLPFVFARLPDGLHEVIVVDGHSTDETIATAQRLRPDVRIVVQTGKGKGNALADGFAACSGDIIVTLDADGSTDPAEIARFVTALCNGADFVKGSRFAQGGGSADITHVRKFGNRVLSTIVNNVYGTNYTDLCYGYSAFWRHCLPYIRVDCDGFEVETLINVRIAKAGLIVHEVPSYEWSRLFGVSNLNAIRDGMRVLSTIGVERIAARRPRSRLPAIARRLMT